MPAETDWFLREWMARYGKRQAALVNELGWHKSKANEVWHGRQKFNRDMLVEIAAWLGRHPYELLLPPDEADALIRLRESAEAIVANRPGAPAPVRQAG